MLSITKYIINKLKSQKLGIVLKKWLKVGSNENVAEKNFTAHINRG